MKKIVLMPDSFKGTMSSREICEILAQEASLSYPGAQVVSVPVADGGEGSIDSFLSSIGGEKIYTKVKGPYFEELTAFFAVLSDGTAVIEMATAAGLPLVGENRHAEKTTTYGVGQLILSALDRGCSKIILCLGGSATNDGGCGAAAALGVKFVNFYGKEFIPLGESLSDIKAINCGFIDSRISKTEFITMCDIDNPLCGINGATYVFAPQKGASASTVELLDKGLNHLSQTILTDLSVDILSIPGSGAAGGMGGGSVAFLSSRLQMGIETVLDMVGFEKLCGDADLVITGEGRIDSQTLNGKAVIGIAKRAKKMNIPVIAITGGIADPIDSLYHHGVTAVFSINRSPLELSEAIKCSKPNLRLTARDIFRLLQV